MNRVSLLVLLVFIACNVFAQTSRNRDFTADIVTTGGAKDKREHNTWSARIAGRDGATRYQLSKEISFDVQFPSVYPTDDGSAIVVSVFDWLIEFYNSSGVLVSRLEPFGKRTAEYEQIIKCSSSGNRAAFLISSPDMLFATVILTEFTGKELWRASLSGKNAAEIFLSADARYVAAGSYTMAATVQSATQVFNASGELLNTFDKAFRCADISSAGFIALSDRNSIRLAAVANAEPKFVWTTANKEEIVTSVMVVNERVASAIETVSIENGIPTYTSPTLVVLNPHGVLQAQSHLTTSSRFPASLTNTGEEVALSSRASRTAISLNALK